MGTSYPGQMCRVVLGIYSVMIMECVMGLILDVHVLYSGSRVIARNVYVHWVSLGKSKA